MTLDDRSNLHLNVARVVRVTEAEGPGRRYALWLQGCPLRCPGCCNPEMLTFDGGQRRDLAAICADIQETVRDGIEGISLLGGEPLAHAIGCAPLARYAHDLGLTV